MVNSDEAVGWGAGPAGGWRVFLMKSNLASVLRATFEEVVRQCGVVCRIEISAAAVTERGRLKCTEIKFPP